MRVALLSLMCWCSLSCPAFAQMWNGSDTIFGNEWIQYGKPWFKISVSEDGIHRIPYNTLNAAGIPLDSIQGARFKMFHLGREIPIYASSEDVFEQGDYIEFFGARNRSELDRYLYKNPDAEMLNEHFSLITDTSAYFLSWDQAGATTLRFQNIPNELNNPPLPENWYWCELLQVFSTSAVQKTDNEGLAESSFDEGEGFSTGFRSSHTFSFLPKFKANTSENCTFRIKMFSNNRSHDLKITLNGVGVHSEIFAGYRLEETTFEKPVNSLSTSEQLNVSGMAGSNDRYAIAWASLIYPRQFNFDNQASFSFSIQPSGNRKLLEISQFQFSNSAPVLYDLTNFTRTITAVGSGLVRVALTPSSVSRHLLLVDPVNGVRTVTTMQIVEFQDYRDLDAEFIIVSHPVLFEDVDGSNPVQDYAAHRSAQRGGSYRTVVLSVEQLYDQFAYGIARHPLAIRNAIHFYSRHWHNAKFVLLIGKGRQYNVSRHAGSVAGQFLVPTFGAPGSDNLLLASAQSMVPVLPVGRIAANTPGELRMYLDKVIAHESGSDNQLESARAWKKEIIHLGGGGAAGEQQFIKNALRQMEGILRQGAMGANVHSYYKTNSDPIQQAVSENLSSRINDGVSILTFFGHSGTGGFDFALDNPASYRNAGRYPAIFSLGCYSGQIHENLRSIGEQFIFQPDRGAIAFFATTGLGYITSLQTLGQNWFSHLGSSMYSEGIGKISQLVIRQFDQTPNYGLRVLLQQYSLHGDPALVITPFENPDLVVRHAEAEVLPKQINTQMDSMTLVVTVRNIGKAVSDSLFIEINRQFPDGFELNVLKKRIPTPSYSAQYTFRLPVFGMRSKGLNRLFVQLDPDRELAEGPLPAARDNNFLTDAQGNPGLEFFVFENSAIPLFPVQEGIVGTAQTTLRASTSDPFAGQQVYHFEMDTTLSFDSSLKLRHSVMSGGGVISWTPPQGLRDSTVYYWRISPDSVENVGFQWQQSSFLSLQGAGEGWNQSHHFQFAGNRQINMKFDAESRRLDFLDDLKTIRIRNGVFPSFAVGVDINNDPHPFIPYDNPVNAGVYIFTLDSLSAAPWLNAFPGLFGSRQPTTWANTHGHFPFWTNTAAWRARVVDFLRDTIPSGNYVILYTIQYGNTSYLPEQWASDSLMYGTNLFQVLEGQGAQWIRTTAETGPRPYIFIYKKDDPSFQPIERLGSLDAPLEQIVYLSGRWNQGEVHSPTIGPAQSWGSLQWRLTENTTEDQWSLDLYGIRRDSSEELLISTLSALDTQLNEIDAAEFPFLRLKFRVADSIYRTAPQIPYWRVFFRGFPDAALDPATGYRLHADTLAQGETLKLELAISNPGTLPLDSLLVQFRIGSQTGGGQLSEQRVRPIPAGDTLLLKAAFDTRQLRGNQQLRITLNPNADQDEQYLFNNIGIRNFWVQEDIRNPLMDVTFDGRRIMDGEIVSAKPRIVISLRDENPWLRLSDTAFFKILLKYPGANDVEPIPLNGPNVRFIAAAADTGSENRSTIEFMPHFTENGLYTLIAQGRDVSGNPGGSMDYRINFEVIMESRMSNILNYPNPFSRATKFVYTLTGEEPPAFFVIRIMTVSGRIVRELTQNDLGPMRIGTHQTDNSWDGTDSFGTPLANGVYLYQVFAKDQLGNDLMHHNTGADNFFSNGIGKLVILR
jgi:hypothetical protein